MTQGQKIAFIPLIKQSGHGTVGPTQVFFQAEICRNKSATQEKYTAAQF